MAAIALAEGERDGRFLLVRRFLVTGELVVLVLVHGENLLSVDQPTAFALPGFDCALNLRWESAAVRRLLEGLLINFDSLRDSYSFLERALR